MVTSTQAIITQYLYALYSIYCFNSSSDGGFMLQGISMLDIEYTNKAFVFSLLKALLENGSTHSTNLIEYFNALYSIVF